MAASEPRVEEAAVGFDLSVIEELRLRLSRWRRAPDLGQGWERGAPNSWIADVLDDWRRFDFDLFQARLDALTHYRVQVDDQDLHVVSVVGSGQHPLPLLLTHGWPGSFLEYLELIPLLTNPEAHGADPIDRFTLVIPSLPGFGFSGPPPHQGRTSHEVATIWHRMMADGFGYERYAAHGSDLGAGVTSWLAREYPSNVAGIHLVTPGLGTPAHGRSPAEERFAEEVATWMAEEGGYMHEHATKPATLAASISDSPAGLAAWIGEKVVAWSSDRVDGTSAFDRDLLLSTLTLYWATNTSATSLLPYWANQHANAALPVDDPSSVPTSAAIFGGEHIPFPKPPRELAERYFNVTDWSEYPVGGHFPAVAEPEILADVIRMSFDRFGSGAQSPSPAEVLSFVLPARASLASTSGCRDRRARVGEGRYLQMGTAYYTSSFFR
jgi:pimeloyl-ACP methyl ester carboxylesterase